MKKEILSLAFGALLCAVAILIPESCYKTALEPYIFLIAFISCGFKVIRSSFKSVVRGNIFNENTLMVIAAVGAFFIGEYFEAVFVVFFYRIGEMFEDYAVKKSRKSISDVMNICPDYANLIKDGEIQRVDPDDIETGDLISVAAGERIPLDGIVTDGISYIDTSALTGESVPVKVTVGDEVLSGCINQNGTLTVKATKSFEDSTVSRILELVETASAKKSTSERFITKFAKYYTPTVLVCALLLAVLPPLLIEDALWSDYIYQALSFLVVSCPCALVISVPLAFFGGIGGAAKQGILIKGGNYLEILAKAKNIVFDKTGTLTKGVFEVQKINPVNCNEDELLKTAAYAENTSNHPIAISLKKAWGKIDSSLISCCEEISGKGIIAVIDGNNVLCGNAKLMEMNNISFEPANGNTVVYVAVDNIFKGSIIISDEIKQEAKEGINDIEKCGITRSFMLTGDIKSAAESVANELRIQTVYSELLPSQKVEKLERIMNCTDAKTIYVGDGINDAPVLARADVGIAMGALGSDAAIEAADVVIMNDEIGKIATTIKTAKKTISIAKQNIIFSLAIKITILVLCSLNIVGMDLAVFGDVGVMVLAVLNSFRALK